MKVCHITSVHRTNDGRIFKKECRTLAKAGHEVYLVGRGDSFNKDGVHVVGIGAANKNLLKRIIVDTRKVYKEALKIDADLYHLHDPELLLYALRLKKLGKFVIFDSHEKYTEVIPEKPYLPKWILKLVAKVYGTYEKHVLHHIDGIIFPCKKQGITPFVRDCKRVGIISNAPEIESLYTKYDEEWQKEPRTICYVGSLSYARGITNLIKAAAISDVKLILAGNYSSAAYQKSVEAMPEYVNVEYKGFVDERGLNEVLNRASIGASTLLNVGQYDKSDILSTKVCEYMAMELPVVLSKNTYNKKCIDKYGFGICVDPDNVEEIAAAITFLVNNPQEARKMGENGKEAVMNVFNWESEAKKLVDFYKRIEDGKF